MFPPSDQLEFITMYILGLQSSTSSENQYVLVFIKPSMKLTQEVSVAKVTSTYVESMRVIDWVIAYGAPLHALRDN